MRNDHHKAVHHGFLNFYIRTSNQSVDWALILPKFKTSVETKTHKHGLSELNDRTHGDVRIAQCANLSVWTSMPLDCGS